MLHEVVVCVEQTLYDSKSTRHVDMTQHRDGQFP